MKRLTTWKREEFVEAVAESLTIKEVCERLGLVVTSGNYRTVHKYIAEYALDTSHMTKRYVGHAPNRIPLKQILQRGTDYKACRLKKRLVEGGYVEDVCALCGIGLEWNGSPLVLQLDHINGDPLDNRLRNLRVICPNCHSQTRTFSGRNKGRCR